MLSPGGSAPQLMQQLRHHWRRARVSARPQSRARIGERVGPGKEQRYLRPGERCAGISCARAHRFECVTHFLDRANPGRARSTLERVRDAKHRAKVLCIARLALEREKIVVQYAKLLVELVERRGEKTSRQLGTVHRSALRQSR